MFLRWRNLWPLGVVHGWLAIPMYFWVAGIDPWDPQQVEWALATRMRAERDLTIVQSAATSRSDPIESGGSVGKLGIDATRKSGDRDDWRLAQPPAEVMRKIFQR